MIQWTRRWSQQGFVEHRGCDEALSKSWPSTASNSLPSCLHLFLLLDPDSFGQEGEADICATLLHYNPSLTQIMTSHPEHFNNVLNCPSSISEEAIIHLPQIVMNASLANSPTVEEVRRAVKSPSTGKAPGSNAIRDKLYILSRPNLICKLTEFFKSAWTSEAVPQEFKDTTIVHLYKRKGNQQCCDSC